MIMNMNLFKFYLFRFNWDLIHFRVFNIIQSKITYYPTFICPTYVTYLYTPSLLEINSSMEFNIYPWNFTSSQYRKIAMT